MPLVSNFAIKIWFACGGITGVYILMIKVVVILSENEEEIRFPENIIAPCDCPLLIGPHKLLKRAQA